MTAGHFRPIFVVAIALLFGIVQLICACMPAHAASGVAVQSAPIVAHISEDDSDHLMPAAGPAAADCHHVQGHEEGDGHQQDCSHCDDTAVLFALIDMAPAISISHASHKTAYINPAKTSRVGMAKTNLAGLRWLDPPRPLSNPTPVKLNNRSLT